jgi:hypothetical protein
MIRTKSPAARSAGKATALLLAVALVGATAPVLPHGWEAAMLASGEADADAVATYQLKKLSPDDYAVAIGNALAAGDADLADSLRALALTQAVQLPGALISEVEAAVEASNSGMAMAGDAWQGFLSGNAGSEPALAGALAADLSGYGDVRDLYRQAGNYVTGDEVDTTTVALAAVGIGLTVATVVSLGAALPERAGVSMVKIVNRLGRLSRPLRRQVTRLAVEAVDTGALRTLGQSLRSFDLTAVRGAARRIVRPAPAAKLKQLGADVATLGENAGYRGTLDALAKAENAAAISRMARLSKTFGKATRGALFMLGDAALTLASIGVAVFSWSAGALGWIIAAIWITTRLGVWTLRLSFGGVWWIVRRLRAAALPKGLATPAESLA